jgi:hypothetical protein
MKKLSLLLIVLSILFYTGCTSTYTIKDFASKQEFYNKFNSSLQDRNAMAQLVNDSVIASKDGAEVLNDTLYLLDKSVLKTVRKFVLQDVKDIKYTSIAKRSADIYLKNDAKYSAEEISIGNDSIEFSEIKALVNLRYAAPLDKVKSVSYKNNLNGIFPGAVTGICVGAITGTIIGLKNSDKNQDDPSASIFKESGIGIIVAGIAGYFVGWRYVYQFNVQY